MKSRNAMLLGDVVDQVEQLSVILIGSVPLIFFQPGKSFYGEPGNEAEAHKDHQRGRKKGWNEN